MEGIPLLLNRAHLMELQNAVTAFHCEIQEETPKFCVYDTQKEGYVLYVKESSVNTKYLIFLTIGLTQKFRIIKSEDYLIIHYC